LIIDDDQDNREILGLCLLNAGFTTSEAGNGREALDSLADGAAPDFIILDVAMPVMDGFEFRVAQLANPRLRSVPTVVVSGSIQDFDARERLQANAYVHKPYSVDEVLTALGLVSGL